VIEDQFNLTGPRLPLFASCLFNSRLSQIDVVIAHEGSINCLLDRVICFVVTVVVIENRILFIISG